MVCRCSTRRQRVPTPEVAAPAAVPFRYALVFRIEARKMRRQSEKALRYPLGTVGSSALGFMTN